MGPWFGENPGNKTFETPILDIKDDNIVAANVCQLMIYFLIQIPVCLICETNGNIIIKRKM